MQLQTMYTIYTSSWFLDLITAIDFFPSYFCKPCKIYFVLLYLLSSRFQLAMLAISYYFLEPTVNKLIIIIVKLYRESCATQKKQMLIWPRPPKSTSEKAATFKKTSCGFIVKTRDFHISLAESKVFVFQGRFWYCFVDGKNGKATDDNDRKFLVCQKKSQAISDDFTAVWIRIKEHA